MTTTIDLEERSVSFDVPKKVYSLEGLQIAAHVIAPRAEVLFAESRTAYELTLRSRKRAADAASLSDLAGDFANELLNQEYRFLVGRFNHKISSLIVTQALLAARGGETPPPPPEAEKSPEFQAQVEQLMREAEEEVRRTMPKKLAPQGSPIPPAPEEASV